MTSLFRATLAGAALAAALAAGPALADMMSFKADLKAHLIAPRDEPSARGRTVCGIRITLREPQAFDGQTIHIGRRVVALPVATHVGVAEVVRHDENNVRLGRLRPTWATKSGAGDGQRTCTRRLNKLPTCHSATMMWHLILPG